MSNIESNNNIEERLKHLEAQTNWLNRLYYFLTICIGITFVVTIILSFCCHLQIEQLQTAVGIDANGNTIESTTENQVPTIPEPNLENGKLVDTLKYSYYPFDDVTTNIYSYIIGGSPCVIICNSLGMRQEFCGYVYIAEASHNEDGKIYLKDAYSDDYITISISHYKFDDDIPYFTIY